MTLSELVNALTTSVQVTVNEYDNTLLLKFYTKGDNASLANDFLNRTIDTIHLINNTTLTATLNPVVLSLTQNYDSHITSNVSDSTVIKDAPFSCVLTVEDGYEVDEVTVEMGGEELSGVFDEMTNTITITQVTGSVEITATSKESLSF